MSTYTQSPYSYNPGVGSSGGGGSGNPGGAINSIQYNLDNINFSGFGSYNSGTGLATFPGALNVNNAAANFTINTITFQTTGNGSQFLANDGVYHPISLVDTNFSYQISVSAPVNFTLFTFPISFANNLIIQWNYANQQVIIVNGDGTQSFDYTFKAIWDNLGVGMPASHYQYNATLAGAGDIILTNTNSYLPGLDLSSVPSNVEFYLSIYNTILASTILLNCTIIRTQYPSISNFIEIKGQYEVV